MARWNRHAWHSRFPISEAHSQAGNAKPAPAPFRASSSRRSKPSTVDRSVSWEPGEPMRGCMRPARSHTSTPPFRSRPPASPALSTPSSRRTSACCAPGRAGGVPRPPLGARQALPLPPGVGRRAAPVGEPPPLAGEPPARRGRHGEGPFRVLSGSTTSPRSPCPGTRATGPAERCASSRSHDLRRARPQARHRPGGRWFPARHGAANRRRRSWRSGVARSRRSWFAALLEDRETAPPAPTAPPHGLTLERVYYRRQ